MDPSENSSPANTTTPTGPSKLSERELGIPPLSPEKATLADERAAQWRNEQEAGEVRRRTQDVRDASYRLWQEWGTRYEGCTLINYVASTHDQWKVLGELEAYAADIRRYVSEGMGLILTGPPGTGKDHLLAALASEALAAGLTARWTSGLRFFARARDDIRDDAAEAAVVLGYVKPDVLILSDPSWQKQPLTPYQQQRLGQVVDDRVNRRKPIWVSINASGGEEARQLLGGPLVDRLTDGALSLPCNWPSHRKSVKSLLD